jgi:hypothetical protein
MKKSIILLITLLVVSVCNAQTLDEIVKKYSTANGIDKLEKASTICMEGKAMQMGTELPMSIIVKRPDKVKVVIAYNGIEIITMYDGVKGYMINPLTGMDEPVEIPAEQLGSVQEYNMFRSSFLDAFQAGRVKLEGEEEVDGKPAYKVAITDEAGTVTYAYIDKDSFLTVKTTRKVNQMGQDMEVESYVKEYTDVDGVMFGKVITQFVNGMELGGMVFDKIELNKEIEDSVFTIE